MRLRVVNLGHRGRQRLNRRSVGIDFRIFRINVNLIARRIGLTNPRVNRIKQRLPLRPAVFRREHRCIHARQIWRRVERHELGKRRIRRAVEVNRAHAPVNRLLRIAQLVSREFLQRRIVGILVDTARAERRLRRNLRAGNMLRLFREELYLIHDRLIIRLPRENRRIRKRRLRRRRTEPCRRRRQKLRRSLMPRRKQQPAQHHDKTRKPNQKLRYAPMRFPLFS